MAGKRKLSEVDNIDVATIKKKTSVQTKCCSKCEKILTMSQFSFSTRDGYTSICRACVGVYHKAYCNTRKGAINRIIRATKTNTESRNASGKRNLATPTLTANQFEAIIIQQGDRCAYSGLPLSFGTYKDWTVSAERLDNDVTYELSNVVAIMREMNTASQWSREHAEYAATHQDSVDIETVEANCSIAMTKPDRTGIKCKKVQRMIDDEGLEWALCNSCDEMKAVRDDFFQVVGQGCKTCHAIKCKERRDGWRGCFQKLLSSAKTRNVKLQKTREGVEDLDLKLEFLVDMYRAQQGACAYSRIPLDVTGHWKISLERKNVRKGYTMDNVCLIAIAFNSGDQTVHSKDEVVEGCSGWSTEKYLYFRANFH